MPEETDIAMVKDHIMDRFKALTKDPFLMWSATEYVELRDLVVARLIIFNAKRGGEPQTRCLLLFG